MTWAYFYFMKDEAARMREVVPHHARYWSETGSAERGGAVQRPLRRADHHRRCRRGCSRADGRQRPVPVRRSAGAMVAEGMGADRRFTLSSPPSRPSSNRTLLRGEILAEALERRAMSHPRLRLGNCAFVVRGSELEERRASGAAVWTCNVGDRGKVGRRCALGALGVCVRQ